MPTVSVVLPIYNIAPYLPQCLDSVCRQTLKDIEIICIDDGSEDGSAEIAADYSRRDGRVRLYRQEHQGVSASRNQGIAEAEGTYILFLDGDDWMEADMLEKMVMEAEGQQADLVICSAEVHCQADSPGIRRKTWGLQKALTAEPAVWLLSGERQRRWELLDCPGGWPFIWNKLMRSCVLKENQLAFWPGLPLGEDGIFLQTLYQYVNKAVVIRPALYHYRYQRRDSATVRLQQNDHLRIVNHWKVIEALLVSWRERGLIRNNETYLLQWIVKFLYGDFIHLSSKERRMVSHGLCCLMTDCQLFEHGRRITGRKGKRLRYMLEEAADASRLRRWADIVWYKCQEHLDAILQRGIQRSQRDKQVRR